MNRNHQLYVYIYINVYIFCFIFLLNRSISYNKIWTSLWVWAFLRYCRIDTAGQNLSYLIIYKQSLKLWDDKNKPFKWLIFFLKSLWCLQYDLGSLCEKWVLFWNVWPEMWKFPVLCLSLVIILVGRAAVIAGWKVAIQPR